MDLNELVRTITQEVLKQMNGAPEKECVVILENRDCDSVTRVLEHIGDDVDVFFSDDDLGGKNPARYILPVLSCSRMADLAAGRASEPASEEILTLLLSGVKVEVFEFEYKSYTATAPGALYSLYESYEKTLDAFGVKEFSRRQTGTMMLRKKLVTEKDVIHAKENGASELRIPQDANITPLAVESALEQNIQFMKF
ncbi:MAG: hypothetical protein B6230_07260 [Desulfobacteraceae bacterium 4572_89]|nr:MAG: hypothetical protein B6230_07260 [Desulfobacteraceae bacterium 4572_89]